MSDKPEIEIVEQTEEAKKTSSKKRWLIFGGVLLLILLLLAWFLLASSTTLDGVKRFFRYLGKDDAQYGSLQFETYGTCSYALTDGRFAVATQSGATLYAEDGSALCRVQGSFVNPAMKSTGELLLVYDIGGTRLVLLNSEGKTLLDTTVTDAIYDAELSTEGYISVLYAGEDCRAHLAVLTENGNTTYLRSSKTHYLSTCAVSPDGNLAAATTLGQKDIQFVSTIQLYQTNQEEIAAEIPLGAQMVYDLRFLDGSTLCAVGEQNIAFFETGGTCIGEYTVDDGVLAGYCFDGDGFVTLLYDLYEAGGGSRLVTLDKHGGEIATAVFDGSASHLSACGDYVAVLTEQKLLIYNRKLSLQNSTDNSGYLAAYVRADGTAMCVSSGEAELYIP